MLRNTQVMSDPVHFYIQSVHSNSQSHVVPDPMSLDAEVSIPRTSSLPPPASSFGCSQCPKSFNRRENLSRHMKTHDVPRTHICQICEKTFTRSDLLKRHEAGHERWDKKEPKSEGRRPAIKRRKTSEDPAETHHNFENFTPSTRSESAHLFPLSNNPSFATAGPSHSNSFQDPSGMDIPFFDNNEHQNLENSHRDWMSSEAASRSFLGDQPINIANNAPHPIPRFTFSHHGTNSFPHQYRESYQDTLLDHQIPAIPHGMIEYSHRVPFSTASYLQPEQTSPVGNEWFSNELNAAMLETGNEWGVDFGNSYSQNIPVSNQVQQSSTDIKLESQVASSRMTAGEPTLGYYEPKNNAPELLLAQSEGFTCASSSPNVPSKEDKLFFLWNPALESALLLEADPIIIPFDHLLFQSHNPRYDISESTYYKIRDFLTSPMDEAHNRKPVFTMPSLYVVNIFIGLYFKHFSRQAPVLHHSTVDTDQLSPPLLSAMMIIGATYSHEKNGRRFSIVLIDIICWQLLAAINLDTNLIRNPMTIFTEALLIHIGLWCGNKRTFYATEPFRAHAVSHMRFLYQNEKWNKPIKSLSMDESLGDLKSQWKRWVNEESLKRLYWFIYSTDRQFSALWNQSSIIAIGELVDLTCPCDEALWYASCADEWKFTLGSAEIPQCTSFAAAIGPFFFSPTSPSSISSAGPFQSSDEQLVQSQDHSLPNLNPQTAFLVLLEMQHQIFEFSQECLLASKFTNVQNLPETFENTGASPSVSHKCSISARRQELANSLNRFLDTYLQRRLDTPHSDTFHHISIVQHHLTNLFLHISFTDVLDTTGKSGPTSIEPAWERLRLWAREDHELAVDVAVRAAEAILEVNRGVNGTNIPGQGTRGGILDTGVYAAMLLTMAHIILWVFAQVADRRQKGQLMSKLQRHWTTGGSGFLNILGCELDANEDLHGTSGVGYETVQSSRDQDQRNGRPSRALFRSAAETLMKFGTWGVALDLALLLLLRAED